MVEALKNFWEKLVDFLVKYDIQEIAGLVRQWDWREHLANPLVWLGGLAFLPLVIWKRKIYLLVMVCSFFVFLLLLQNTLPPPGQSIPLHKILEFLGGCVLLLGVNVYFLLLREK